MIDLYCCQFILVVGILVVVVLFISILVLVFDLGCNIFGFVVYMVYFWLKNLDFSVDCDVLIVGLNSLKVIFQIQGLYVGVFVLILE